MSTRILSITVLLLLLVCSASSANNRRHVSRKFPPPCCIAVSTANISDDVSGDTYREQSAEHPCVRAVILTTQHGLVCVDPKKEWVQNIITNMTKV